jgi:TolB protein
MTAARAAAIGALDELLLCEAGERRILGDPEQPGFAAALLGFAWPTWLGDGDALAVSTIGAGGGEESRARLLRLALDGSVPLELLRDSAGTPLVGPRTPHYVNPSPDGRHLLALVPGQQTLRLLFVDAHGRGPAQPLASGAPLFSAWSPRGDSLLIHSGGELSIVDLASAPSSRRLAANHVGYRVPAWSPSGDEFAVSVPIGRRASLEVWDREGVAQRSLGPSWNGAAIAWSPDGTTIAQAAQLPGDGSRFGHLQLVPASGGSPREPYRGSFLQMLWSPDGAHLALLVPGAHEGSVGWLILERAGERVRRFAPFDPSAEFGLYTTFFDQYALSHRLWSPDGLAILACGRGFADGPPREFLSSCVYVCDLNSGTMDMLTAGAIAFYPPRTG